MVLHHPFVVQSYIFYGTIPTIHFLQNILCVISTIINFAGSDHHEFSSNFHGSTTVTCRNDQRKTSAARNRRRHGLVFWRPLPDYYHFFSFFSSSSLSKIRPATTDMTYDLIVTAVRSCGFRLLSKDFCPSPHFCFGIGTSFRAVLVKWYRGNGEAFLHSCLGPLLASRYVFHTLRSCSLDLLGGRHLLWAHSFQEEDKN